jgi:hypothetical protein
MIQMPAVNILVSSPAVLCARCRRRPPTQLWVGEGGAMSFIHGGGQHWCGVCVAQVQLDYARAQAAAIPEREAALAAARAEAGLSGDGSDER